MARERDHLSTREWYEMLVERDLARTERDRLKRLLSLTRRERDTVLEELQNERARRASSGAAKTWDAVKLLRDLGYTVLPPGETMPDRRRL